MFYVLINDSDLYTINSHTLFLLSSKFNRTSFLPICQKMLVNLPSSDVNETEAFCAAGLSSRSASHLKRCRGPGQETDSSCGSFT